MSWLARHYLKSCRPITTVVINFNSCSRRTLVLSAACFRERPSLSLLKAHNQWLRMTSQPSPQLRHLKYRDKIGGKLPVPSIVDVQVVGSGGRGTPRSVLLTTDHSKYLFNCGEGTQRIAAEFKMRLSKLENIFITHKSWSNIGGLLGMGLTLEATKVPKVVIHGPPGVENVAMMAKGFAESTKMVLEKKPLSLGSFEDSAFRIDYVPFCKTGFDPEKLPQLLEERGTEEPEKKKQRFTPTENVVAVAYVCWPHPPQRNIILEKCVDLGIERGPVLGKLKNGESITLDNGTVIDPDQVLSDPEVIQPIVVVDCPSEDYLQSFTSNEKWSEFQMTQEDSDGVTIPPPCLVVHMSPEQVYLNDVYQQWVNRFPSETEHLVLNESTSDVSFEGVYRYQSRLHLVHSTIFPHLRHLPPDQWTNSCRDKGDTPEGHSEGTGSTQSRAVVAGSTGDTPEGHSEGTGSTQSRAVVAGSTGLRFQYRPRKGFNRDQCIRLNHEAYLTEALQQEDTEHVLKELHTNTQHLEAQHCTAQGQCSTAQGQHPRLTFLGTGSSVPSKGRNVSGIVLHLREDSTMILDCGEGTSGQLYRHYGNQTAHVLRKLKAVFVSHMHADHHMGLFSLLRDRRAALESAGEEVTPLLLLAPIQMARWLSFYDGHVEPVENMLKLKPLQDLLPHKLQITDYEESYSELLKQLDVTQFLPVEVDHCPNAFGVSLTHCDGWKLVYSGDTVPCHRLVTAGKNCDVLIHEATHEDDLEEEANRKRHSTTSQAIDIGQRMGAKFIVLTHFSQRYAKIPVFSKEVPDNVGIAFDNMTVTMEELPLLPHFIPALKTLFAEEHADLEARTLKRNRRKEMIRKVIKS